MAKKYPKAPPAYTAEWGNNLIRVLSTPEPNPFTPKGYTATGASNITLTSGVSTLSQTQDFLATLIADLQKKGII